MTRHSGLPIRLLVPVCIALACVQAAAAGLEPAGEVEFARGAAVAQRGEAVRVIGRGERFYSGEVLSTSKGSFAVVRLDDGSRLTLRPETQFTVESINAERNAGAGGVLRLFRGGVRALTGFISKYNQDGLKLETPVATMGIRGTEFDARLCDQDCEDGQAAPDGEPDSLAARIAFARGQLSVRAPDGGQRPVQTGATIHAGERVIAGQESVAVLVFSDNSRVTLQPRSEILIRRYEYNREDPGAGESVLELLRGGLRAVTGLIGKLAPERVEVRTPVATIGIRGTGFDLLCRGRCSGDPVSRWEPGRILERLTGFLIRTAYAQNLPADGMYAYVWSGQIELQTHSGRFALEENSAAFLADRRSKPTMLPQVPRFMRQNPFPRPDRVKDAQPPAPPEAGKAKPGLYVSVYDGEVAVGDTLLKPGDTAFTGSTDRKTRKLDLVPRFFRNDAFPRPSDFKPSVYRLLDTLDEPQKSLECEL